MTLAATESVHYATAAAAAFEADDVETTRRCVHALKGLARNFEATELEAKAIMIESDGADRQAVQELLSIANSWAAAAGSGKL